MTERIVYVASPSLERERARKAMDTVRRLGAEVAHDWVRQVDTLPDANRGIPPGPARALSLDSFRHLRRSRLLWLLFPKEPTIGTFIETGAFLMHNTGHAGHVAGARLIVSGTADLEASIYLNGMAHRSFAEDEEVTGWLRSWVATG